ncbi:hypothetical protein [Photorhabdus australis]|uniref:hypothetical protein n=1 Tax=Photorhabdus australis TaxID=286156 RepID=UPI0030DDA318
MFDLYLLSFKLPLCWLHSLRLQIRSLAVAIHLEIYWVYLLDKIRNFFISKRMPLCFG